MMIKEFEFLKREGYDMGKVKMEENEVMLNLLIVEGFLIEGMEDEDEKIIGR